MKNNKSGHKRLALVLAIICLVVGIGAVLAHQYASKKTEGIEDSGISTGSQNSCLAYDAASDTLLIGTHQNQIIAFHGKEEIWRAEASGAYSSIVINDATGNVYAGNENNHVYVYQLSDGAVVNDIDVQRRVVALDVSDDGATIAAATVTGTSKANVILMTSEGEQLISQQYKVKIAGITFTNDNENIIIGNNRGEIIKMNLSCEEIAKYATNYSILQMINDDTNHMVICKNGGYFGFDDDLNIIRQGIITNTAQAVVESVGTDASGEYVVVGTREGYIYILNENDEQVYSTDVGTEISGFTAVGNNVYMTGLGDFVQILHVDNLQNIGTYQMMSNVTLYLAGILLLVGIFLLLLSIEATGKRMKKLGKDIFRHRMAYILLLPTFLLVWFFNYRGIGIAFIRAFTNWSITNNTVAKMDFVGFENFITMVTEGYFLVGMKNLLLLMVTAVIKTITVPILAAWLVYAVRGDKKKYIYRFLFVLPIVVPGVIASMTWQKIYDPNIGLLNELLSAVGLESLQRVWLGDAHIAIWAIIFMGFPFISAMAFLVYYGGFIGISSEIEESARVDGAKKWDIFWKIQLPMIRPQISIMLTLTLIGTMQDFNNIYILTGGGPGTSTYVPALELYFNVAQFGRYGYACALGVVLFIFTMIVTITNMKLTKERG